MCFGFLIYSTDVYNNNNYRVGQKTAPPFFSFMVLITINMTCAGVQFFGPLGTFTTKCTKII